MSSVHVRLYMSVTSLLVSVSAVTADVPADNLTSLQLGLLIYSFSKAFVSKLNLSTPPPPPCV